MESGTREDPQALADLLLRHPLRARLFAELKGRDASPEELAEALSAPLPSVAYHCSVLRESGLGSG